LRGEAKEKYPVYHFTFQFSFKITQLISLLFWTFVLYIYSINKLSVGTATLFQRENGSAVANENAYGGIKFPSIFFPSESLIVPGDFL
jgi:hypothetical protein